MLFRIIPEGLGEAFSGPQPEVADPDKEKCLDCAFAKLLTSGGVKTEGLEHAAVVITEAQYISTTNLNSRATIYRCGVLGCEYAKMTITNVNHAVLPIEPKDIQLESVPGSADCVLPTVE